MSAILRRWPLVLGMTLLAVVAAYLRSSTIDEVYEARVALQATAGGDTADGLGAAALARRSADLAGSAEVVSSEVRPRLRIEVVGSVGLLRLTARGPTPSEAAGLAHRVASRLASEIVEREEGARATILARTEAEAQALERNLTGVPAGTPARDRLQRELQAVLAVEAEARVRPAGRLEVVEPARASSTPITPRPQQDAARTAGAAFVTMCVVALLLERRNDRFTRGRVSRQVEALTGLPVLAAVPRADSGDVVEAMRALRTSLMFVPSPERLRSLAVVAGEPRVGRSFIARALAEEAAALDVPVALVDADLRAETAGSAPGLSDVLRGAPLVNTLQRIGPSLELLPAGSAVDDPPGLLGAGPLADVLDAIPDAELVVVDTPAADQWADALAIACQCDAALLVVDANRSRRRTLVDLVERLRQVGANAIGVVVNDTGG